MAKRRVVAWEKCSFGNNVSHANNRTRRKFSTNLWGRKIYVSELDKNFKIKLSAAALRNIAKSGPFNVLKKNFNVLGKKYVKKG